MTRRIEMTFFPDGKIQIETKGFSGNECRQASQFLEQSLGQQTKELLTTEFHHSAASRQRLQERQ